MKIGDSAPDFNLPDISGETVSLTSLSDKELLVIIFACNHCPYVKAYMERIIDIQNSYSDKGLEVVLINPNDDTVYEEDSFENMKRVASEKGFNFKYLRDADAETAHAYEAKYTPEAFLFDRDRRLRYSGRIDDNWSSETGVRRRDLRCAIDDIIAKRDVAVKKTAPIGCTIKWPKS